MCFDSNLKKQLPNHVAFIIDGNRIGVDTHASTGALVISGFWSVVNERFDPHSAKGMVSRIGTGATVGGVVGGLVAWRVGEAFDAIDTNGNE